MTRTEFREAVFKRDKHRCIWCGIPAVDAHHIIDRSLFKDGGYELENGVSLCEDCHWDAEQGLISPQVFWDKLGVKPFLPTKLDPIYTYDKWGNILYQYLKYPRTYHLPWSENLINDDKGVENCNHFLNQDVVVTEKLDGENTTGYADGKIHARSLDSDNHPTRNWVKGFLTPRLYELPHGWRICGENVYAKHSIHYHNLRSYFYLFSIWTDKNICLSWNEMVDWAKLLGLEIVPTIYMGLWDEASIKRDYNDYCKHSANEVEGYVVRKSGAFGYAEFKNSVAKYVRKNHVQTSQHWMSEEIVKNETI